MLALIKNNEKLANKVVKLDNAIVRIMNSKKNSFSLNAFERHLITRLNLKKFLFLQEIFNSVYYDDESIYAAEVFENIAGDVYNCYLAEVYVALSAFSVGKPTSENVPFFIYTQLKDGCKADFVRDTLLGISDNYGLDILCFKPCVEKFFERDFDENWLFGSKNSQGKISYKELKKRINYVFKPETKEESIVYGKRPVSYFVINGKVPPHLQHLVKKDNQDDMGNQDNNKRIDAQSQNTKNVAENLEKNQKTNTGDLLLEEQDDKQKKKLPVDDLKNKTR